MIQSTNGIWLGEPKTDKYGEQLMKFKYVLKWQNTSQNYQHNMDFNQRSSHFEQINLIVECWFNKKLAGSFNDYNIFWHIRFSTS